MAWLPVSICSCICIFQAAYSYSYNFHCMQKFCLNHVGEKEIQQVLLYILITENKQKHCRRLSKYLMILTEVDISIKG